jgi:hypothetical protein
MFLHACGLAHWPSSVLGFSSFWSVRVREHECADYREAKNTMKYEEVEMIRKQMFMNACSRKRGVILFLLLSPRLSPRISGV